MRVFFLRAAGRDFGRAAAAAQSGGPVAHHEEAELRDPPRRKQGRRRRRRPLILQSGHGQGQLLAGRSPQAGWKAAGARDGDGARGRASGPAAQGEAAGWRAVGRGHAVRARTSVEPNRSAAHHHRRACPPTPCTRAGVRRPPNVQAGSLLQLSIETQRRIAVRLPPTVQPGQMLTARAPNGGPAPRRPCLSSQLHLKPASQARR